MTDDQRVELLKEAVAKLCDYFFQQTYCGGSTAFRDLALVIIEDLEMRGIQIPYKGVSGKKG